MLVAVATAVPLNDTQSFVLHVCGGFRSIAVDQLVEALGLTFTRHVAFAEFPRIQPDT
jgi:hypothetical protein